MKKSELRQIIKEEIKSVLEAEGDYETAMDKFSKRVGGGNEGGRNVMGLPLEKLPEYNQLDGEKYMMLPSTNDAQSSTRLYTKEEVDNWVTEFTNKFGVDGDVLRFKKIAGSYYDVINSQKYLDWKEKMLSRIGSFMRDASKG